MPYTMAPISAERAHHYKGYKPRRWPDTLVSDISALWYRKLVVKLYARKLFSHWRLDTAPYSQQDCVNGSVAWARPALHCLCQKCLNCYNNILCKRGIIYVQVYGPSILLNFSPAECDRFCQLLSFSEASRRFWGPLGHVQCYISLLYGLYLHPSHNQLPCRWFWVTLSTSAQGAPRVSSRIQHSPMLIHSPCLLFSL